MRGGRRQGLLGCERGVSAVEFALVGTIFLGLLIGIIKFGLVLWTQSSLHFAVEAAARCTSVNTATCGSQSLPPGQKKKLVEAYALNQYFGQPLSQDQVFQYTATGCGHTVTANYTYPLSLPFYGTYSLPLSATACFP